MKTKIEELLSRAERLLEETPDVFNDLPSLIHDVMLQELYEEVNKLKSLLIIDDLQDMKTYFESCCLVRDAENQNTVLHYSTSPTGFCNALYFELSQIIYPGRTFKDLFQILMPCVKHEWVFDASLGKPSVVESGTKRRRLDEVCTVKSTSLDCSDSNFNELPVDVESFKSLTVVDGGVLVLVDFKDLSFNHHCKLYRGLRASHPRVLNALCRHNQSIAALYSTVIQLVDGGATLREVMSPMIRQLSESGQRHGNGLYASLDGSKAAQRLIEYVENLPDPLKSQLLACRNSEGIDLGRVKAAILKGECVETTSEQLNGILSNVVNAELFDRCPVMDDGQKATLKAHGESLIKELAVQGHFQTTLLPKRRTAFLYQQLQMSDLDELHGFLTWLPTTEFTVFLSSVTFLHIDLVQDFGVLMEALMVEQQVALIETVLTEEVCAHLHFESKRALIKWYTVPSVHEYFSHLSLSQRLHFLVDGDRAPLAVSYDSEASLGEAIVHAAAEAPFCEECLLFILEGYPLQKRLSVLKSINQQGVSVIELALVHSTSLSFLRSLSVGDCLDLLMAPLEPNSSKSVMSLMLAARQFEDIQSLFDIFPSLFDSIPMDAWGLDASNVLSDASPLFWMLSSKHGRHMFYQLILKQPRLIETIPLEAWFQTPVTDQGIAQNTTPLYWLSSSQSGCEILAQLLQHPELIKALPGDAWCSIRNEASGVYMNTSPLYWLTANPAGRAILTQLLDINPGLIDTIPPQAWYLAMTSSAKGSGENTSPLYWLSATCSGRVILETLCRNSSLMKAIPVDAWCLSLTATAGEDEHSSPIYMLSATPSGARILTQLLQINARLIHDIPMETWCRNRLASAGADAHKSALYWLSTMPHGRAIIKLLICSSSGAVNVLQDKIMNSEAIMAHLKKTEDGQDIIKRLESSSHPLLMRGTNEFFSSAPIPDPVEEQETRLFQPNQR